MSIGLVTGSAPFAGLPDNPASDLLGRIDGAVIGGVTIRTAQIPVSRARLPAVIGGLIEEHRPDFYVSLGLATGAPVLRFETTAINRVDFGVADNEGDRPTDGGPIEPGGPDARFATWDAKSLARTLVEAESRPSCRITRGRICATSSSIPPLAPWPGPGCRRRSGSCICPTRPNRWRASSATGRRRGTSRR
jgi:pyrrolidone-carboxylate peptidase